MRRLADRLTYRTLITTVVVTFGAAGAATAYALPLAASRGDGWFAAHDGNMTTGLVLGLFTSYVGVHIAQLLAPTKGKRHGCPTKTSHAPRPARPVPPTEPQRLEGAGGREGALQAVVPQPLQVPDRDGLQPRRLACPRKL